MMELVCAFTSTLLMGDTTPEDRKRTAKSFCSTATVLTVTGGIGAAAAEAPLAGAAGADAAALAGVALALLPVVPAPAGVSSLLPQALSKITDRLQQRLAFRNEFERVFFILK
jgi:hypothetical protein